MCTLLIVDDERTIREGIAASIDWKALGITRVLLASDGRMARRMITAEKPAIAIVDIVMPEMTGIELITECRKERECPEFVIISGHDEFTYAREALRNHVHDYILKPCDVAEITEVIRRIAAELEQRRSAEAERRNMRERLEALAPGSRERLLRDHLTGARVDPDRLRALRDSFEAEARRFQLLVLCAGLPGSAPHTEETRRRVEASPAFSTRMQCVMTDDSVVMIFTAEQRGEARVIAEETTAALVGTRRGGCGAAISAPGDFEELPQLFVAARQGLRRAAETRDPAGPFVDASDSPWSAAIQRVMRHVQERYAESSLSLGAVARDVLRLNGDYVGKLFKKECGICFNEYLTAVRMEQAGRIIAAEDLRVYEVAERVGLGDDAAYFTRLFHKYTGVTPGEYRKARGG